MEEIIAYKCRCGNLHEYKDDILKCKSCGKEICLTCASIKNNEYICGKCWQILF